MCALIMLYHACFNISNCLVWHSLTAHHDIMPPGRRRASPFLSGHPQRLAAPHDHCPSSQSLAAPTRPRLRRQSLCPTRPRTADRRLSGPSREHCQRGGEILVNCSQYGSPPPQQGYDELSSQTRWRVRIFARDCLFVQSSWIWSYLIWFSLIPSFFGFIILWMCVHMYLLIVLYAHAFTFLLCINAQCATGRRHMPLPGVSWTGYIITNIVLLCKRIFFVIIIRGIINCAFLNECESVSSHPMPLVAMSADDAKKVPIHRSPDMTDNISIIICPSDHGMASVWWSGHTFLSRNIGIVS